VSIFKRRLSRLGLALAACTTGAVVLALGAAATDTAPRNPGSGADAGGSGSVWANTGNGALSDDTWISTAPATNATSNYLKLTNFGFTSTTVPNTATITGITVTIERSESGSAANIHDASVKLVKGGTILGTDHAQTGVEWPAGTGAESSATYGSSSDLWGTTLTPADVQASNFGVAISVKEFATAQFARVDTATIVVSYTTGGGGGAPVNTALPAISGPGRVNSMLSATKGSWTNSPTSYAYQWKSCNPTCSAISGATLSTYFPVAADQGKTIVVTVTATNGSGSTPATSSATAAIGASVSSFTADTYTYTTFYGPGNPGSDPPYTSGFTGAWKDPTTGALRFAFGESSGTWSDMDAWVRTYMGSAYLRARDHYKLTNVERYFELSGGTWNQIKPVGGVDDVMKTWANGAGSCVTAAGSNQGANCNIVQPEAQSAQADIQLEDGTLIRRTNGEDIPYAQNVERTAYIQRLAPGGSTWGTPEYLLDATGAHGGTACGCTYQISRIHRLRDGRLIALGQKWDAYNPKGSSAHILLMVGDKNAQNWTVGISNVSALDASFAANEWDATELPNGDLLAIFRTKTAPLRKQALLHKSGSGWTVASTDIKNPPFTHSGHPDLITTSSGAVLDVATDDDAHRKGIWYLSYANAQSNSTGWTLLPFSIPSGTTTGCASIATGTYNCSSSYYPQTLENCVGTACTLYVIGTLVGDDDYWETAGINPIGCADPNLPNSNSNYCSGLQNSRVIIQSFELN
jgi:hypothetical protein